MSWTEPVPWTALVPAPELIVDQPGQVVGEVAGRLTLMDTQWDQIERDIDTIRSLEREGIFVVDS